LAPLWGAAPGAAARVPAFAVFATNIQAGEFLLLHALLPRRLPVIWDLDETLLVASSASKLDREAAGVAARLAAAPPGSQRAAALQHEATLLDGDRQLLRSFSQQNLVRHGGAVVGATPAAAPAPRAVPAAAAGERGREEVQVGVVHRPVISLEGGSLVLTRIKPDDPSTSMVFRLRPHWLEVWPRLAGFVDAAGRARPSPALPYETYVCTTAEGAYAQEAWRVLDAGGVLIPPAKCEPAAGRRRRRICDNNTAAGMWLLACFPRMLTPSHPRPT
jgi:hypothetical protein